MGKDSDAGAKTPRRATAGAISWEPRRDFHAATGHTARILRSGSPADNLPRMRTGLREWIRAAISDRPIPTGAVPTRAVPTGAIPLRTVPHSARHLAAQDPLAQAS